jgi:hypothetical protein
VNGVGTPVDTNLFNGALTQLRALTLQPPTVPPTPPAPLDPNTTIVDGGFTPGLYQGATIGSSSRPKADEPNADEPKAEEPAAPLDPCR